MSYRTRTYYTEEQKALMWDRWQQGDSLATIARLFDRGGFPQSSVFCRRQAGYVRHHEDVPR